MLYKRVMILALAALGCGLVGNSASSQTARTIKFVVPHHRAGQWISLRGC